MAPVSVDSGYQISDLTMRIKQTALAFKRNIRCRFVTKITLYVQYRVLDGVVECSFLIGSMQPLYAR